VELALLTSSAEPGLTRTALPLEGSTRSTVEFGPVVMVLPAGTCWPGASGFEPDLSEETFADPLTEYTVTPSP
jgi:hypothetical protein